MVSELAANITRRFQQFMLCVPFSFAMILCASALFAYLDHAYPNTFIKISATFPYILSFLLPIRFAFTEILDGDILKTVIGMYVVGVLFSAAAVIATLFLYYKVGVTESVGVYSIGILVGLLCTLYKDVFDEALEIGQKIFEFFGAGSTTRVRSGLASTGTTFSAGRQHHVQPSAPAAYAQFLQPSQREAYRTDIAEGLTKFRDLKWVDFDENAIQQEWDKGFWKRDPSIIYNIAENANTAAHQNWTQAQGRYNDAVAYVDKMRSSLRASAEIATASLAKYKIDYSTIHVPQSDRLLGLSDKAKLAPPKFYTKLNVAGSMGKLADVGIRSGHPIVALLAVVGTVAHELSKQQEAQRRIMEFQGECRTQIRAITQQIGTFEALIAERVKPQFDEINASIEALETFTDGLRRREQAGSMDAPDAPVFLNKFAFELVKARQIVQTKAGEA